MALFVYAGGIEQNALDLDLDLTPRGQNPEKEARASARPLPPGREERGAEKASGDRGGARRERGPSGQARARSSARPCPQAGRQSAARAALAGAEGLCYPCGGLHPASATGARGGPEPTGPRWGAGGEWVSRAPKCPAKALESARNPKCVAKLRRPRPQRGRGRRASHARGRDGARQATPRRRRRHGRGDMRGGKEPTRQMAQYSVKGLDE